MLDKIVNEDQATENEVPEGVSEVAPESSEKLDNPENPQPDETAPEMAQKLDNPENGPPDETVSEPDSNETFPREYVEKLRKESAKYRERAQQSDELARRLHVALVRLDGRLADPEDVEFAPEHLDDGDALTEAITALVEKKPGLRAQQLSGDVGQGKRGSAPKPEVDLISIMRKLQ